MNNLETIVKLILQTFRKEGEPEEGRPADWQWLYGACRAAAVSLGASGVERCATAGFLSSSGLKISNPERLTGERVD